MSPYWQRRNQAGIVLVVSLLVLLVMGVIATTVARTNQLQLHMAGNNEMRIAALQRSLAVVDSIIARSSDSFGGAGAGHRNCLVGSVDASCDEHSLTLDPGARPAAGELHAAVVRMAPELGSMPVLSESDANSTVHYQVAKFEVQVSFNATAQGRGRAALTQGVLVRLSSAVKSSGDVP